MTRANDLVELYRQSCRDYADRPLFGTRTDGTWTWTTYRQFGALVDDVRSGLAGLGVGRGDRVAIIADNSVEWAAAAYATYGRGAAYVPMYQAQRPAEWKFILGDCEAKAVIAANERDYDTLQSMRADLPTLEHVIGLERPAGALDSWAALVEAGAAKSVPPVTPAPDDLAGFIYTSGTTGKPKGALLTHGNIASNLAGVHELFPIESEDRALSFLPWAHSFGQTCELHMLISFGASTAINDELPRLLDNLGEVKPTMLVAVPRIFNRLYEAVNKQIGGKPAFIRRMVKTGLRAAVKKARGEKVGLMERLELAIDDKIVFSKVRARFGGRLRMVISGSASLSRDVAEFIDALGIPFYEGYGLTETSPIVSVNIPGQRKIGSVGRILPGVRVEIDKSVTGHPSEGEIVVYGPNVMRGYHNRPEETKQAISADGGLHTGDLGYFDAEGFLFISGRIKEQYKLENGKYVMPSVIEDGFKLSPYIANVMLYGDGKPFNVALIVASEEAVKGWAAQQSVTLGPDISADPEVRKLIAAELERLGTELKGYEKPRDFALVREDFTIDNGLLTPTLKLKRREVVGRYSDLIAELYARTRDTAAA